MKPSVDAGLVNEVRQSIYAAIVERGAAPSALELA